jgi:predicted DNA-binding protein
VADNTETLKQDITQTAFRFPSDLYRSLKVYAAQNDTTVQAVVIEAVSARLEAAQKAA